MENINYFEDGLFYGSENFFRVGKNLIATDGAKFVFDKFQCYWIGDCIQSYIPELIHRDRGFYVCRVVLNEDQSCKFFIDDDDEQFIIQEIEFTDLKENIRLFVCQSEENFTVMLPSEY